MSRIELCLYLLPRRDENDPERDPRLLSRWAEVPNAEISDHLSDQRFMFHPVQAMANLYAQVAVNRLAPDQHGWHRARISLIIEGISGWPHVAPALWYPYETPFPTSLVRFELSNWTDQGNPTIDALLLTIRGLDPFPYPCPECGPGYHYGEDGCRHYPPKQGGQP